MVINGERDGIGISAVLRVDGGEVDASGTRRLVPVVTIVDVGVLVVLSDDDPSGTEESSGEMINDEVCGIGDAGIRGVESDEATSSVIPDPVIIINYSKENAFLPLNYDKN